MDSLNFYRAFEDRHRGSRELIKSRLEQYSPFLELLTSNFDKCTALDIGCGRGEWLELLTEKGFTPQGVDLDSGMLAACLELGFDVKEADGIKYLESFESDSLHLISAFHVVEHIGFEQLQNLVKQALRVLVPGGLLILETPNPENIVVASANFYLDPTHIKPIPPLLLSFVTEFAGFKHNKIVRLQESVELREKQNVSLSELLFGVSPDYSVVAQKPIDNAPELRMTSIFEQDFGLSLSELSARLDNRLVSIEAKASEAEAKASEAEAKASEAEAKVSEAEAKVSEAEAKAKQLRKQLDDWQLMVAQSQQSAIQAQLDLKQVEGQLTEKLGFIDQMSVELLSEKSLSQSFEQQLSDVRQHLAMAEDKIIELNHSSHHWWTQAQNLEQNLHATHALYESVLNSKSWKITLPLRLVVKFIKWLVRGSYAWLTFAPQSRPRRALKSLLVKTKNYVIVRPKLKRFVLKLINFSPRLKNRLRLLGLAQSPLHISKINNSSLSSVGFINANRVEADIETVNLEHLTPRAKQIYAQLKQAIEQNKKELT